VEWLAQGVGPEFKQTNKKRKIMSAEKWMELEIIMLSEISQVQKAKYCMVSLLCGILDTTTITITIGHDCKRGTVEAEAAGEGREKERVMGNEQD
jgi:hypothetical protein